MKFNTIFLLFCVTCLIRFSELVPHLVKHQACDETWTFCSPSPNETWYHHNHYEFKWNRNNSYVNNVTTEFNIHLFTLTNGSQHTRNRIIKSWVHLSNKTDSLPITVTDDWFPSVLPAHSPNITWTVIAFLTHDSDNNSRSFSGDNSALLISKYSHLAQFYVVQSPSEEIPLQSGSNNANRKRIHTWVIAVIATVCTIMVIVASVSAIIIYNKKMQKKKDAAILSTPDAAMIADTFRQVMSSSTTDLDRRRSEVGEDLLKRQLAKEGTSVSEIERRTSSKKSSA